MKKVAVLSIMILALLFSAVACGGPKDEKFVWTGLEAATISKGDVTDPLTGVTVKKGGTDLTSSIVVLNSEDHETDLTALGVWEDFEDFNYNVLGEYTVYYKITSDGKSEIKSKEINVIQGSNVGNGDFSMTNATGFYSWSLDTPGGSATLEKATEGSKQKPKFNITNSGNAWYALQYMNNVDLVANESYRISVKAKSETGKALAFGFENPSDGYKMLCGLTVHKLTSDYETYVSYFTSGANYTNAKAVLYFGKLLPTDSGAHNFVIDSIKIEKIEKCSNVTFTGLSTLSLDSSTLDDLDLSEGVTASDGTTDLTSRISIIGEVPKTVTENATHDVLYVIENDNGPIAFAVRKVTVRVYKVNAYDLANGNFSSGLDYWMQDLPAGQGGDATYTTEDEAAKITVKTPSGAEWHIQLHQSITMAKDVNYIIKAKAKASVNRTISLEVRGGASGSAAYSMSLTNTYKDFEFAYNSKIAGNAKIGFLLGGGGSGNINSEVYIDDVVVELDPDQTQYQAWQLINPEFNSGMKNWGYEGAVTYTSGGTDDKYVVANITDNTDAGWRIQFRQDGLTFEKDVAYKLVVRAKSSVARSITAEIRNLAAQRNIIASDLTFTAADTVQTFELPFTPTQNENGIRVGLLLGGQFKDTTITFYQFEVVKVAV